VAVSRRRIVSALLLILCLGAAIAWQFRPAKPIEVATTSVTRGPIQRRIVATGTLQAIAAVQVGAQESGTIQSVRADFNSIVHAGEIIATLQPDLFAAALDEAKAALARAEAAEAQAEADEHGLQASAEDAREKLTRAQSLATSDLIPQADLDAARTLMSEADIGLVGGESRIGQARAAVDEARAAVAQASIDVDRTVIRSPIDGIVISRNVDVGQTVAATLQAPVLFTIATDLKRLQVNIDIDESDIGGVQPGARATFDVDAYPRTRFTGTVSQVRLQPSTVDGVVAYTTELDVSNVDERLRPGMTATVALDGARRDNAVRIPNAALAFRPSFEVLAAVGQPVDVSPAAPGPPIDAGQRRVWRFDDRVFTPIDVRVGLADDQWTELVAGPVGPGDALVAHASPSP